MSKYSSEFKLKVVKCYLEEHHEFIETAKHFKISPKCSVKFWVRKCKKHGAKSLTKILKHHIMEHLNKVYRIYALKLFISNRN